MTDLTDGAPRLAFVFDRGFSGCTMIALHSALRVTPGPLEVWLHPTEVGAVRDADLSRLSAAFPQARLHVQPIDLPEAPTLAGARLPLAACGRLCLPGLHQGRMIYLDGDVLVRRDLAELWRQDLGGKALGACLAPGVQVQLALGAAGRGRRSAQAAAKMARRAAGLGGLDLTRYFNSGVLLMDFDRIRARGLDQPMRDIAKAARLPSLDQDWLNIVFRDDLQLLPAEWNSGWGNPRTAQSYVPPALQELFREGRDNPALVHFTGAEKPWTAPQPPFRLHYLTKPFERRQRARFWADYQAARQQTEALLGRPLFAAAGARAEPVAA